MTRGRNVPGVLSMAVVIATAFFASPATAQETIRLADDIQAADPAPAWDAQLEHASAGTNYWDSTSDASCDGFGSCGCDAAYDTCCDDDYRCGGLTFRAGVLFMKRESPGNVPLVIDNNGAGPVVLSGSDFDFDYEVGAEASIIWDNPCLWAPIEFRYMWINDWTATQSATGLTNPVVNTTPQATTLNTLDYADYKSEMQSMELHFRRPCCNGRTTLLAGFRYISFDEDLDMQFDGADRFWWGIENDLYGLQLGLEHVIYDNCCNFRLEGFLKAGIYGNDAKTSNRVLAVEEVDLSETSGMDHVAFAGELGLVAEYDVCCNWTLRAGYQALWLDGVLVAANQVPGTNTSAQTVSYNYTTAFFHGALFQAERRW